MTPSSHNIGFISTRFAGTDGVSLETAKWAAVLERLGHKCFYFAGECDREPNQSHVVPEAFYRHPEIDKLNQQAYSGSWEVTKEARAEHPEMAHLHKDFFSIYVRPPAMTRRVNELKDYFKDHLYEFARRFELEILIVENALTIPLNLPLGLAITEFIAETGYPVIAHHHDFHWERQRFQVNCVGDYLAAAFPPTLPSIRHVVINSIQAQQIASRYGLAARVIPNVMDFDSPPPASDSYGQTVRADFGIRNGEYFFLQPTRVIQRKGIEHAIELMRRLDLPAKLIISHAAGDEGTAYEKRVREYADLLDVTVRFESDLVQDSRGTTKDGKKIYTLGDVYPHADLVTYPSAIEGFGNAFLEAVYYRRLILVNNYSIYEVDIKPKGFRTLWFDGFISDSTLDATRNALKHPDQTQEWTELNYQLAQRYFSYTVLERRLESIVADCLGYQV
ncbi:MAG TPA: glycosyltransferase family 4 protein [Anaerolineales bacterium]|nr:glycosyltransferase family 4 protein [Anaerolineales bacterium]HNS59759.1 glycosyltransferase family 4 protein [Anaerolineales bacterium]